MRLKLFALVLILIVAGCGGKPAYTEAWDENPEDAGLNPNRIHGHERISYQRYHHPTGAFLTVPKNATVTIEKNTLLATYPGCIFEHRLFVYPTEEEAKQACIAYIEETDSSNDEAIKAIADGKLNTTIPDPDKRHRSQQNLSVNGNSKGIFSITRHCGEGSPHPNGCGLGPGAYGIRSPKSPAKNSASPAD